MSGLSPSDFFSAMDTADRAAYRRACVDAFQTDTELAAIDSDFQAEYAAWIQRGAVGHWTEPAWIRSRRLDRQRAIENDVLWSFMEAAEASIAA